MSGNMNIQKDALRKIQELSFVKCELELYLDTHPECKTALDYYKKTVEALDALVVAYEAEFGPVTAEGCVLADRWSWVDGDWPWYSGMPNTTEKGKVGGKA